MAIYRDGKISYEGAVISETEHYWADGMLEVIASVWDMDEHCEKNIQVGYYGSDGCNLCGNSCANVGVSTDVARDIIRTKKAVAFKEFCDSVVKYKTEVKANSKAVVVRGKKVPKGTLLNVFWVGDRPTYRSRQYSWMHETEKIAGAYDENGNKVWIKADYLKVVDEIKSPSAKERKKFMEMWMKTYIPKMVRDAARGW